MFLRWLVNWWTLRNLLVFLLVDCCVSIVFAGHPRNRRQVSWWCPRQWGVAQVKQKLSLIDDAGTFTRNRSLKILSSYQ